MDKNELIKLDFNTFLLKLNSLPYEERIKLLNDKDILLKVFLLDSRQDVWNFQKVMQVYKTKDLLEKLDDELIDLIKNKYSYYEYVYLIIFKRANQTEFEKHLKNNDKLLRLLLEKGESFYSELNFSYDLVIYMINFMKKNNINYKESCLFNIITMSITKLEDQEKYMNSNIDIFYKKIMITLFDVDVVNKFIKNNNFYLSSKEIFNILMYSEVLLNPSLYYNEEFFRKMILSSSFLEMRKKIISLSNHIDTSYYENLIVDMEKRLINNYKKNKKFISNDSLLIDKDYIETENAFSIQTDYKILLKLIIDKLFQDSIRNVYLNIKELLDFKDNNLSKDKIEFYKDIISLLDKDADYLISFYDKYNGSYQVEEYYDDIRKSKNNSYQLLKESVVHINDINNLKNNDLSNHYQVPIYEFNGEKFYMLVTCRSRIPEGNNSVPRNCYSLIGYNNMHVFNEDNYIFGFENFDINKIMHIYEDDSYSLVGDRNTTQFINRIRTPDEILSSNKMNEIQIKNEQINGREYERLFPSYVICFDDINDKSIIAAKSLNIPLILIHKDKYKLLSNQNFLPNYEEKYAFDSFNETIYQDKVI